MAEQTPSTSASSTGNSLSEELRKQVRVEIDGAELTNPEKFMLDQKYGITDPVFIAEELVVLNGGAR